MSVQRTDLQRYLDKLLNVADIRDYCPNGLQVEGRNVIQKIVTGVTASQKLIDRAIELQADAIIVHHGYFWKSESAPIVGMKRKRIQALMTHEINLFAYHLPLDVHPQFGNNIQLAQLMGVNAVASLGDLCSNAIGLVTEFERPRPGAEVRQWLEDLLSFPVIHVEQSKPIKTLALCTGAAQGFIDEVAALGVDAYLSGEISEPTVHAAEEQGIHYFAAGHHATERYGVKALGEHLAAQFDVAVEFVDLPIPV
ncbi:Nif3-like dinuclear metal center hexameric protein [Gynuella sp.]|uniref:Nif3-like dinuclear metal center hexameric protein n=1 Tax=Gynuella sp. TaxID=2969146 RepID=UPI003D127DE2